jgi:hypothetical protein
MMETIETDVIPQRFLTNMLSQRCNIISNPQTGKTNLTKVIVSEYVRQGFPVQIKMFDTCQVFRHSFLESFKLQEINGNTSMVYRGEGNIIYDVEFDGSEKIMQFVGTEVKLNYHKNRELKKNGDVEHILYVIEEAQNSLGRYALTRKSGDFWLKTISEGANFGLSYLFVGQRAADISTSVIERSTVSFIGKTTGDNNIRKVKSLIGDKAGEEQLGMPIHEVAKTLELGQFIWWNGQEAWKFKCPLFEDLYPNQKPMIVSPPPKRWEKIF